MNLNLSEKDKLRQRLVRERRSLDEKTWREKSDRICQHLLQFSVFREARLVLAYFSIRQEPDLSPLFEGSFGESSEKFLATHSNEGDRAWGFPHCLGKELHWHRWQPGDAIVRGKYGICEPAPEAKAIAPAEVDLLLVPAVGCDRRGFRLGYGGGYYDRLLAQPAWQSVPTLGITFAFACPDELPVEPWDVRLQGTCTEEGIFWRSKQRK